MNNTRGNDARHKELRDKADVLRMGIEETKNSLDLKESNDPVRIIIGEEIRGLQRKHLRILDELEAIGGVLSEEDTQARNEYRATVDDYATDMAEYDAYVSEYRTSLNEHPAEEMEPGDDKEPEEKPTKVNPLIVLIIVVTVVFLLMIIGTRVWELLYP